MAVNATAVWRARPANSYTGVAPYDKTGSNTNGGGFDAAISGAGTDYSQQNTAQATGTNGVTVGTAIFVDATANAFTPAMVGNAMYITGTGQTTGFYFVVTYTSASTVTLDRSPGTGTGATWNLGGGWANFWTNVTVGGTPTSPVVPGNFINILGSGVPNSSYTYDYAYTSVEFQVINGNNTIGKVSLVADPATPGYNGTTTGGMPCISFEGALFVDLMHNRFNLLWFVDISGLFARNVFHADNGQGGNIIQNCVLDQFGNDCALINSVAGLIIGCEIFSSVVSGGGTTSGAINTAGSVSIIGCNFHDLVYQGIVTDTSSDNIFIEDTIIAKATSTAIVCNTSATWTNMIVIKNCTIDGNGGNGIEVVRQSLISNMIVINNIITNHVSGYGITIDAGSTANNNLNSTFDYNSFYNNSSNYNNISAGAHDTALTTDPYVNQAIQDYRLK